MAGILLENTAEDPGIEEVKQKRKLQLMYWPPNDSLYTREENLWRKQPAFV